MAFDIRNLQKGREPVRARSKADEGHAVLKYIDVDDLVPSEGNFYSMSAIEELAWVLEVSGGVKQPALVTPLGGGKYKVIAGHRRRLASLWLVQQGKEAYRKMPCIVESVEREQDEDADTLRAIDDEILLPERLGGHQVYHLQDRDICPRVDNTIGRVLAVNRIKICLYLRFYRIVFLDKTRI